MSTPIHRKVYDQLNFIPNTRDSCHTRYKRYSTHTNLCHILSIVLVDRLNCLFRLRPDHLLPMTTTGTLTLRQSPLHGPLRGHGGGPGGKPIARSSAVSRMPAFVTTPRTPAPLQRRGEELAEHAVRRRRRGGRPGRRPGRTARPPAWIMRLSPGWTGRRRCPRPGSPAVVGPQVVAGRPVRPIASWTVATPNPAVSASWRPRGAEVGDGHSGHPGGLLRVCGYRRMYASAMVVWAEAPGSVPAFLELDARRTGRSVWSTGRATPRAAPSPLALGVPDLGDVEQRSSGKAAHLSGLRWGLEVEEDGRGADDLAVAGR